MVAPWGICRRKAPLQLVMEQWENKTGQRDAWGFVWILQTYILLVKPVCPLPPVFLHIFNLTISSITLTSPHQLPLSLSKMLPHATEWRNKTAQRALGSKLDFFVWYLNVQHDPNSDTTHIIPWTRPFTSCKTSQKVTGWFKSIALLPAQESKGKNS